MRLPWKALFLIVLFVLVPVTCGVVLSPREAEAATPPSNEAALKLLPPLGGLTVRQMGSHAVVMQLTGASLPLPEIISNTSDSVVFSVKPAYLAAG